MLIDKPRTIDQYIATPAKQIDPAVLLAGWTRLARTDRDGAIARFDSLVRARDWSAREASPYALALALPLAWDRRPEALQYFALVDPADLDDNALEWQARAALWTKNWSLVSRTIASMSPTTRDVARWRYWSARAADNANTPDVARQLYRSVLLDDNYYSAMAAARLGEEIAPRLEKLPVDRTQLRELEQLPEFVRARELYWSSLRPQAMIEWLRGFQSLSETARTQAIHLAVRWGWYDQAVATATQQRHFNDYTLLYPRPFDREVQSAARLTSLEPELIYGVLRQESLYRADAMSAAGARGLLQLIPETARHTARVWKQPRPSADDLFDPKVNVALGAAQLRMLVDRFGGQTPVALAGYNAGPNAAARWLPDAAIESDVWIENIPYNETRSYVQRVLWHSIVFAWLRSGEAQRTDAWMTRIAPASPSAMVGAR
jgi:soluble lytic murein transglycosylase